MPQHQSRGDEGDQQASAQSPQPLRCLLIGVSGCVAGQCDTDAPHKTTCGVEHEEPSPRHPTHASNSWHDGPEERGESAEKDRPATPFAQPFLCGLELGPMAAQDSKPHDARTVSAAHPIPDGVAKDRGGDRDHEQRRQGDCARGSEYAP